MAKKKTTPTSPKAAPIKVGPTNPKKVAPKPRPVVQKVAVSTAAPTTPPTSRKDLLEGNAKVGILNRVQAKELEGLRKEEEAAKAILPFPGVAGVASHPPVAPAEPVGSEALATPGESPSGMTPFARQLASSIALSASKEDHAPHVIVTARAGTGKTTTLVEGLKELMGVGSKLTPSPQQRAVWDAICMSRGKVSKVGFVAFNKSIANELKLRVPPGCDAMTMHSLGNRALNKAFDRRLDMREERVDNIIAKLLNTDIRQMRKQKFSTLKVANHLVGLCKMNLTNAEDQDELMKLVTHYEIDTDGCSMGEVFDLVPQVLAACKDVDRDRCIDFDDMIWLPVVLGLPVFCYDLLLVDEAQDLNRCQQALAKVAGKRLILCGDPKQAIYGFAGADADSMPRMMRELGANCPECGKVQQHHGDVNSKYGLDYWSCDCGMGPIGTRGCIELPLTVTRRCGKAIVDEARKLVPDFEAFEENGMGKVSRMPFVSASPSAPAWVTSVKEGDFILCRVNAPLVSQCFRFLKEGRKATIVGRDIANGLISTIKKLDKQTGHGELGEIPALIAKLTDWQDQEIAKEQAKRNPNESRIITISDRVQCIIAFTEGVQSVADVIRKVDSIFTDKRDEPGIRLSSIHKAKGLEAKRVFLLQPKGATIPHPMSKSAWQREQEYNLLYVAITRAIEELVYVS